MESLLGNVEEQRIEAQERRVKERAKAREAPSEYPWGKNVVDRDESGKLKTRKWLLGKEIPDTTSKYPGLAAQLGREGAGAPLRGKSGKPHTRIAGTVHGDTFTGQHKDIHDPWGKPGAGAPLRDQHGHATGAGVYGTMTEKRSAHEQVIADKREAGRGYGMDVASWMRTGEVGMPKPQNPVTGEVTGANKKISDITALVSYGHVRCQAKHLFIVHHSITTFAHPVLRTRVKSVGSISLISSYKQKTDTRKFRNRKKPKKGLNWNMLIELQTCGMVERSKYDQGSDQERQSQTRSSRQQKKWNTAMICGG